MSQLRDYIGDTDAKVLSFTANFGTLISDSPTVYGLSAPLATSYMDKQADYAAKLTAATDPLTRGKRTVFLKQEAKKELVALTRQYAQQINKMVTITNEQRQALGLTIADTHRTPVPVPQTSPFIQVKKQLGRTVTIELRQEANKRGRPSKVAGATIFTFTGANPPTSADGWKFSTNTTKTTVEVPFGSSNMGDTVWITAFWNNSRDESGPAAWPVSLNLPASPALPSLAANTEEDSTEVKTETKSRKAA